MVRDNEREGHELLFNYTATVSPMLSNVLSLAPVYRFHAQLFDTGRLARRMIAAAGYRPGLRLLDIGCGPGDAAAYVKAEDYVGVDVSEQYIAYARQHHGGDFHVLSADCVDQLPGQFDLAIVLGVLHHLSDEQVRQTLGALARVMKPGGQFVVLEAVWPTHRWDLVGYLLRKFDRGKFVRTRREWVELLGETWQVHDARITRNLVVQYFECVLTT